MRDVNILPHQSVSGIVEGESETSSPQKPSAKVIVTEICPEAYYKTVEITPHMTAFEVIVKLIQKYAKSEEDSDPDLFYLTEASTCDSSAFTIQRVQWNHSE